MNRPSINNLQELLDNQYYKAFDKKKKEIQSKYDERLFFNGVPGQKPRELRDWFLKEGRVQWREYLKEMSELMLKPDSDYQKFVWDIIPVHEKRFIEEKYGSEYI